MADRNQKSGGARERDGAVADAGIAEPQGTLQFLIGRFGHAGAQRIVQMKIAKRRAARLAGERAEATAAADGAHEAEPDGVAADPHQIAAEGTRGQGGALPHLDTVQRAFGHHDVSHVRAHTDGEAAEASEAMGAEAFASGDHVAFAGTPSLHTAAHEAAHVVQQRSGVHLKGGVGQAGDPHERHADAVADAVVAGQSAAGLLDAHTGGSGGAPAIQRQPTKGGAALDEHDHADDAKAVAKAKAAGVTLGGVSTEIVMLLMLDKLGMPVSATQKNHATNDVARLADPDFAELIENLQKLEMLDDFLGLIGPKNAKKTTDKMHVEFDVPAVAFAGTTKAKVDEHYERGNKILGRYNMKIKQESFTQIGNSWWEKLLGRDNKSLLGNDAGTFKEADLDASAAALDKLIDRFLHPGMVTSFWFSDLVEDVATYGGGRSLHGQAVREKSVAKYKGKEAVFMDINAAGHVFAHELGHIIGGAGKEAEHVTGADGTTATGDQKNVMYQYVMPGKKQTRLTAEQIEAFKTGIYAKISRAHTKPAKHK